MFKKNLEEAFNEYNVNGDQYLNREEFKNFMVAKARHTQQDIPSEEMLD